MEWAIRLGEFVIRYELRKVLKPQALVDFMAELIDSQKEDLKMEL